MLEHRYGQRVSSNRNVLLFHESRGPFPATAVNISAHGMLVRCESAVLRTKAVVDIHFWTPVAQHQLQGLVIHQNGANLGILLKKLALQEYVALLDDVPPRATTSIDTRTRQPFFENSTG